MAAGAYRVSVILRIEKVKKFEDEEQRLFGKDGFSFALSRLSGWLLLSYQKLGLLLGL